MDALVIKAFFITLLLHIFSYPVIHTHTLTAEAYNFRNDNGVAQFALYNREGSLPDEHFKKHFKLKTAQISNGKASITFKRLPPGTYAINVLHDENKNGIIDKGLIKPKEGLGFSNYEKLGLKNRPRFSIAKFDLAGDSLVSIKIIYL